MSEEKPQQKFGRNPQALSSEYHKARKQVMLWAGILLAWALVGVDLAKAEATGGNIGAIITAIKSPQAIPWVLVILVAYFLFKVTVEWYQCSEARRGIRVARVDFLSAWIVALMAYALYFGQTISRVQFADVVQAVGRDRILSTLLGAILVLTAVAFVSRSRVINKGTKNEDVPWGLSLWWALTGVLLLAFFKLASDFRPLWKYVLSSAGISTILGLIGVGALRAIRKRKRR